MKLTITTTMLEGRARNIDRTLRRMPARCILEFVSSLLSVCAIGEQSHDLSASVSPHLPQESDFDAIFMNSLFIPNDFSIFGVARKGQHELGEG